MLVLQAGALILLLGYKRCCYYGRGVLGLLRHLLQLNLVRSAAAAGASATGTAAAGAGAAGTAGAGDLSMRSFHTKASQRRVKRSHQEIADVEVAGMLRVGTGIGVRYLR